MEAKYYKMFKENRNTVVSKETMYCRILIQAFKSTKILQVIFKNPVSVL